MKVKLFTLVLKGIPTTLIFGMIIGCTYYYNVVRKRKVKDVNHSKENLEKPL
jgi:hypothetical protein